jgi:D-amino-acid dehydrogenase
MHVIVLGAGLLGVTSAYYLRSRATRSPSSTARPRPPQKPASPTAGRSRSATPSPGPTRARRSRCCSGWARKTHRCCSACAPTCASGCGACSSCANARPAARATTSSRSCAWAPTAARRCSSARDTGIQYDERTQGILHFYTSSQRNSTQRSKPGRTDARAGLRAPCDQRRRGRPPEPALRHMRNAAGRRHLHGRRRIGRCQPLCTRAGQPVREGGRDLPHEPHRDRAARGRRAASTMSRPPTPKAASSACAPTPMCWPWAA